MKVIDLLQKIANGEIEPNIEFFYKKEKYIHIDNLFVDYYVEEVLNDEVEIWEDKVEDKKIEDIGANNYKWNYKYDIKTPQAVVDNLELLRQKTNEIIDYINGGTNGE